MNATAEMAGLTSQRTDSPQACRLVIFDCDGVLVDSEPIAVELLLEMISAAGGEITREAAYERFLGCSLSKIVAELEDRHQITVTAGLLESMRVGLYERFKQELQPIHAVGEALSRLEQPFCVASSSQPERIRLSLSLTGLADRFASSVSTKALPAAATMASVKPSTLVDTNGAALAHSDLSSCHCTEVWVWCT